MKLYNSYTQQVEDFVPMEAGKVNMYVCGPTVYNDPHIGNARPIVVFDTLYKTFEALGYDVTYASNYTDVDDKIIKKAIEENKTEKEITDRYIESYKQVRKDLGARNPDYTPRVTETMDKIIHFIDELVQNGSAYVVDQDVYFRVNSDSHYGELSHQKVDDLLVGARIDENDKKENPLDFTLWKKTDQGIQWDSPWGKGRPGWHTECVVMIQDVFKKPAIDIHGGGLDLKFPHHENEMAQARQTCNSTLANTWIHNGMINVGKDKVKMSKSLGNVMQAKDLIEEFGGPACRWMMISTHYRAPLTISETVLENAQKEISKIQKPMSQAKFQLCLADKFDLNAPKDEASWKTFIEAMEDDLNTPNAISALQSTVKEMNQLLRKRELDYDKLNQLFASISGMLYVLGIDLEFPQPSEEDKQLYCNWKQAVCNKDYATADECRAKLMELGLI
ncbi:cysteine--tRNA ligase [Allobaculum stercoricanis]|uniref:cysteine--tRNA ligase n=1 Tax=Allobaculum stercoricanis TaxID=174709 RepID=UPI000376EAD4|nr:cysteine--tRNA ligase [Allobaculum stercoricanis]